MTKKTRKTTLASIITAVYILATMTACSSEASGSNPASDTVTTTYTELQTPTPEMTTIAPETTTVTTTTTVTDVVTTTEKQTESTTETTENPAPETTTVAPETTTVAPETTTTTTKAPETTTTTTKTPETTTIQTTTSKPQTEAAGAVVEKYNNKKMYLTCRGNSYKSPTRENFEWAVLYDVNDEVTVVAKVKGTGEGEGFFYKLKNGTYVPCEWLTDNKNWQAETTYQTFDWQPGDFIVPETPDTNTVIGDMFD